MAANPFLFSEEPYTSPVSTGSNPFLLDPEEDQLDHASGPSDNPFLSQTATTMSTTNPFSFDPMELEPAEAEVPNICPVSTDITHIENDFDRFDNQTDFGQFGDQNIQAAATDFNQLDNLMQPTVVTTTVPQKPSDLDLKYSHQANDKGIARPLPPRPPPSKETQDLLMSVMGQMDATSSSLLGKIPPTRSPSPVNMRDLHSPSPTPDPAFADLLDVTDKPNKIGSTTNTDLFSLNNANNCDINQNPQNPAANLIQTNQIQQNQAANLIQTNQIQPNPAATLIQTSPPQNQGKPPKPPPPERQRPPKPPPPAVLTQVPKKPVQFIEEVKINNIEDIDMFGLEEPIKKKEVSKADILNLYNAPVQETKKDLLFDDVIDQPEVTSQPNVIVPGTIEYSNNTKEINSTNDINIPSEQLQEDLQMDLIDDGRKGSVGTTTFNPFAPAEDFSQPKNSISEDNFKIETNQNLEPSPMEIMDTFGNADMTTLQPLNVSETTVQNDLSSCSEKPAAEITSNYSNNVIFGDSNFGDSKFNDSNFVDSNFADSNFGDSEKSGPEPTAYSETIENVFTAGLLTGTKIPTSTVRASDMDAFGTAVDFDDDFEKKFDSVKHDNLAQLNDAWGNDSINADLTAGFGQELSGGFEQDDGFDAFLALREPSIVPQSTPNRISKANSLESDEDKDFSVVIRPKGNDDLNAVLPTIAPPPIPVAAGFGDTCPRFNPFDNQNEIPTSVALQEIPYAGEIKRSDSQETPPTPLFDEDVSQPLEPFPRINFTGEGWEMQLRQPNKKKITGQRFWKKIFTKLQQCPDCVLLQLFNQKDDKDPFQELPLQPCYSVSEIGAQQYDQFGKIFTLKLQYIFYKERPGVRPGQVKKAEKITNRLSQFAAYAIQGDYQGCKEFGSDLKKLGLPVEHAPQVSQLMKLGSLNYEDLKQFSFCIEEALFKLDAHRDRALHYKMEEVQVTAVDELYVEQENDGHIKKQIARVRLFFLGFLTGMPDIELGVNDMRRQGKEVVGRHDIIPVETEEWIRLENVEFHSCIEQDEYNKTHIIKFKPPDACYIELLRFRVRPPKNRELPLQLKAQICVTGHKIELRADVLVPGFASRKLGQVPCEDVMIRFPIPECWIYLFRVEKHFRYGSVKSAHRRTGKIKGIERILGTMETLQENLIEVTSGQAKYEHQHRAIVWRCPRLPKEGQGAYTTHNMVCRIALTSYDQMPEKLPDYCYVEFTMPATQVSHTTCRSVSLQNTDSDDPPEKYVRYLARHEYKVGIEHTQGQNPNAYASATYVAKPAAPPTPAPPPNIPAKVAEESSSDSD